MIKIIHASQRQLSYPFRSPSDDVSHPALLEVDPCRAGVCQHVPPHRLDRGEHGHGPGVRHALVHQHHRYVEVLQVKQVAAKRTGRGENHPSARDCSFWAEMLRQLEPLK